MLPGAMVLLTAACISGCMSRCRGQRSAALGTKTVVAAFVIGLGGYEYVQFLRAPLVWAADDFKPVPPDPGALLAAVLPAALLFAAVVCSGPKGEGLRRRLPTLPKIRVAVDWEDKQSLMNQQADHKMSLVKDAPPSTVAV